jgi:hypothetical protein
MNLRTKERSSGWEMKDRYSEVRWAEMRRSTLACSSGRDEPPTPWCRRGSSDGLKIPSRGEVPDLRMLVGDRRVK